MAIQLGMQLPRVVLSWATGAENAFSVQWLNGRDGSLMDLTGTTVRLVIDNSGTPVTFNATNTVGSYSNWTIAAVDALAAYLHKPVRLELVISGNVYLMGEGTVEPA